ncbi:SDR family oxidoreductase [Cupriavidus pampae]|uniref:Cis-2,3-dihydrobiphenyl-2,3-diol dehydrogenase n=1 Tax=Cupriavidus pampae TaxID=659251 RepID=A0ABM8WAM9_9BURK|nr:SDR family oxidoreductase [Cupriavidus pampae]CAG9164327.1 Cis-2,3-dihydrobiphenyl-2,3-diol dehydrogenase [Cupriavidus pampae]
MNVSLQDKSVVIAGGTSGIGLALARKAVVAGAKVHIIGRSTERLALVQAAFGSDVVTHCADIGIEGEVEAVSRQIPRVDHLVTTAAALAFKPFVELRNVEINLMLNSKFWGPIYLVRHLSSRMSKDGSITFFSGLAAYKATSGGSIVAAVNGGLDGLARTLALELAPIRVNVVSPGVVDSSTWDFLPEDVREGVLNGIGSTLPVGRVGRSDELAEAGLFLMTNGFATGTILQVDGGANA